MSREYEVGFGRPPRHTRFKKGRSGNPKGRPRRTRNLKTDLIEELTERILVREGERSQRVTRQRALVKQLVNGALKGQQRAQHTLISLILKLQTSEVAASAAPDIADDDQEILARFIERQGSDADESENNTAGGSGEAQPGPNK